MQLVVSERIADILERVHSSVRDEVLPLEPALVHESSEPMIPHLNQVRESFKRARLWLPRVVTGSGGMAITFAERALVSEPPGHTYTRHVCVRLLGRGPRSARSWPYPQGAAIDWGTSA